MNDNITIKKAGIDDSEILKNFMLKALKEDPLAFSVNYEEYAFNSEEWWQNYLTPFLYHYNAFLLMAIVNGQIIGMVGGMYQRGVRRKHLATIVWFFVDKGYRGQKIGKKLMDNILDEIKTNKNITKISLMMNAPQEKALSIYKQYGFKIVGTLEKEMKIGDEYYNEYIMELLL